MKKIFKWFIWILFGLIMGALIFEGIGPHALFTLITSILLILISLSLLIYTIKFKKNNDKNLWRLSGFFRGFGIACLFASLVLLGTSLSLRDLPQKYNDGIKALNSGQWDKAIDLFSAIENVNPNYKDTMTRLKEARLNKAKDLYNHANDLLSNAKMNLSKKQFRVSQDSTIKAISLLSKAKEYNESEALKLEAEKFYNILKKEVQNYRENKNEKQSKQHTQNKQQITREEKIQNQFSLWDGSHRNLEKLIKKTMNDPKSYKHVETVYWDKGDHLIIKTTFRGKNVFGGMVINWVTAKVDYDGNVMSIIEQGP